MSKLHVTFVTCDEKPWLEALHGLAVSQRGVIEIYKLSLTMSCNYFHTKYREKLLFVSPPSAFFVGKSVEH